MAMPRYRVRIVLGGVLLAVGLFWTAVSGVFLFMPDMRAAAPVNLALAVLLLAGPGAALWLSGRARRAREHRMKEAASVARAAGRVRVEDVARTLGAPASAARRALLDAVAAGVLHGRFDVATDTFVGAADAASGAVRETAVACGRCGASSTALVTGGEAAVCRYCGATT